MMEFGILADVTEHTVSVSDLAIAVEGAGLESLFLTQHTHIPASRREVLELPEHRYDAHLLDPFVAFGAAAAVTSRLKLGTGICQIGQHDPIILAKQVATLDHISQGRVVFGVGPGWLEEEMRNHGLDPRFRWAVLRERVLAMKEIWTKEVAEFHGRFVDFDPILLEPKPVQRPHPPVLVTGQGPRALRRVVEYGDGWMPLLAPDSPLESRSRELSESCEAAGRRAIPITAVTWEIDERLIERCAELGVARYVVYVLPERDVVPAFLDRLAILGERING